MRPSTVRKATCPWLAQFSWSRKVGHRLPATTEAREWLEQLVREPMSAASSGGARSPKYYYYLLCCEWCVFARLESRAALLLGMCASEGVSNRLLSLWHGKQQVAAQLICNQLLLPLTTPVAALCEVILAAPKYAASNLCLTCVLSVPLLGSTQNWFQQISLNPKNHSLWPAGPGLLTDCK